MSSYNDIEPWALHALTHATCHSDWRQRAGYRPTVYKIRGFTLTASAITPYTHKLWHRRYFFNREVPYWLQSSITGSALRGLLILQKNSMLTDTKIFRSRMGAFRCIDTRYPSRVRNRIRWKSFYSMLRSDCVIAQLVWQTRLENRTSCNSFSPDLHVSGTFERRDTLRLTRVQGNRQAPYGRIASCSGTFTESY